MTRMNRLLKLLCAVLVLCGLLCCAGAAGAEGDVASVTVGATTTAYSSLDEALASAQASNGATLTLLQNVDGEVTVTSGSFTLDLNGCTITGTNQSAVTVSNSAVCLAIVDSKGTGGLTGPHGVYLSAADEVNLRGIRITATGNDHSGVQIESGESSTVNISGCTINSAYAGVTSGVSNEKTNGAVVNISGGTSITVSVDTIGTAVSAYEGALTITGGSYTGGILVLTTKADISGATITESRDSFNAVDVWSSAEVTFTDCTISATGAEIAGVSVSGKSTATIASGTITGTSYGVRNYDGNTTITGGRISGGTADLYNRSSMTLAIADGQTEGATFPGGLTVAGGALADMLDDSVTCWVVLDGRDTMLLASGEYTYGETGVTGMGDVTIRAICDHADIVPEYIIRDTTHTLSCPVCSWAQGDTESHNFTENSQCTCGAVCAHVFADGACTTCGLTGGYCGASANEGGEQSVTWTLADNHLVISGTGAMADYSFYSDLPWRDAYQTITDVTIGEGVTHIGKYAFYNFRSLTEITIPASVESIGYQAFGNSTVSSVTFAPNSRLTTIDGYAFSFLDSLKQITLPASVESIGNGAFEDCDALETVTFAEGSRLSSLGYMPFFNCYSLTAISIPESATACKTIDGVLYSGDGTTLLLYPAGKTDEAFTTPAGVTTIAESAFAYTQLHNITLSEGVTMIGMSAFSGCTSMQSVSLPSTLTSIGEYAFANCGGLTTITIPASMSSIGEYAFAECRNLTTVTIPAGVSSIGDSAFFNCNNLTTVTIPASVTSIGSNAFAGCDGLTTVNAPCNWDGSLYTFADTVTVNVPAHAFADGVCTGCGAVCEHPGYEDGVCTQCGAICAHTFGGGACTTCGLTGGYCGASTNEGGEQSVTWTLADNHLVISGTGAMADYSSSGWPWDDASKTITDVTIGEGVTHIGKHAFYNFRSLTEITIPASVEAIGHNAFGNSTVSSVTFAPNSRLTTIDDYAFSALNFLKQITLPASVETIEEGAFEYCSVLETVTFAEGSRLSILGYMPFYSCTSLTAISIPESVTAYKTIDGVLYSGDGTTLLCCPGGRTDPFTTPAGVTTIAENAFSNTQLHNITLSEGVTTIGISAFSGCYNMQSVSLPSTLTSIGNFAFNHCSSLTTVTIPASVSSIGGYAFENCYSLTEVTIPASVTSIGDSAFAFCDALTTVNTPCTWDGSLYTFEDTVTVNVADHIFVDGKCTACGVTGGYCGASANAGGEQSVVWTYRDGKLTIRGEGAMADFGSGDIPWSSYKASITSLTIAEGVTSISKKAFSGSGITRITIPASVESVGILAFQDCSGLAIVEFADGSRLTTIDSHAFAYCTALMQITVPASVSSLDSAAFVGCEQLTDIVVASGNTTYQAMEGVLYRDNGTTLLYYPMGRTEAEFSTPEGVTSISADAFRDAVHLETLNMTFVTYLDAQAFGHNETLSTVVIPPP